MSGQQEWPDRPVPQGSGDAWHWQLRSPEALSRARGDLRARMAHPAQSGASTGEAREGLLLAFEELVSNAVVHGRGDVRAVVVAGRHGWLLDVSDEAPELLPVPATDRDPSLGGMGLPLVADLATEVGVEVRPGRKHVWATLPSGLQAPAGRQAAALPQPRRPSTH